MFDVQFTDALLTALAPASILFSVLGIVIGIIFGAIPGLTATLAIALFVPITFIMSPTHGLIMLGGIYAGAIFGGSISAILINVPGTPASIITGWEGYAMARRGDAPFALALAAVSSGVGGALSAVAMLFLTPVLAKLALSFGPPEFVALLLFSLAIVVVMLETPLAHNLLGCLLGLTLASIGQDPINGAARFTFGMADLLSGVDLLAVLIGFFCMTQAFFLAREALSGEKGVHIVFEGIIGIWRVMKTMLSAFWTYARATVIGIFLGIMPAIGPESTPFVAHAIEKKFSKTPEEFGNGSTEGLIASETSISANVGGSLIPLLSLGIPGSAAAAVFIGALTLHGMQPGPLLFVEHGNEMYAFLIAFVITNIFMVFIGLFAIRYFAVVLRAPKGWIAAFVAFFSIFGSYAVNSRLFDVGIMFVATAFTLLLRFLRIPILPVVLGVILGSLLEQNLVVFFITIDSVPDLMERPVAIALFGLAAIVLVASIIRRVRLRQGHRA
jgi:putative tricarboxylic transport membrane protein